MAGLLKMVQKEHDAKNAAVDQHNAGVDAAVRQASQANDPYHEHKISLRRHNEETKARFEAAQQVIAPQKFNKQTEIDTKGMDVIDEDDLGCYCEMLADLLDESDKGLPSKLMGEIKAQQGKFSVGGLKPLMKTQSAAVDNIGAFSIVQVACAWKGKTIAIHYIQKGIGWTMVAGEAQPNIDQMTVYHQYRAVQELISELEAGKIRDDKPWPAKLERSKMEKREKYGLM